MRYAILNNDVADDFAEASTAVAEPLGWIQSDTAQKGDHYDAGTGQFTRPDAPKPEAPRSVTRRQARLALLEFGLLDEVDAAVAAIPGEPGRAAQIEWADALTIERDSPMVAMLAQTLPLTAAQLDQLFTLAASL